VSDVVTVDLEVSEQPAHWVAFDLNGAGKLVCGFSVIMLGWSLRNQSSSTLAALDIYDGADTSGQSVFPLNLAANEASVMWLGPNGVWFKNALYVNVTAQEVKGSILFRHRPHT
jgi:hypothetical protein